jgi:hypothetical protein
VLKNKEGLWTSKEEWNFRAKGDLIYIENISKTKVFGTTSDGKVILKNVKEDQDDQLWKKGETKAEGYFTLENSGVSKVLTAISESGLEGLKIKDPLKSSTSSVCKKATNGTISISATEMEMIPSPLSMLLLKETGKISHTMAGDDFPEDPEGKEWWMEWKIEEFQDSNETDTVLFNSSTIENKTHHPKLFRSKYRKNIACNENRVRL